MKFIFPIGAFAAQFFTFVATASVGTIEVSEFQRLIAGKTVEAAPVVIDTRGGYKDYFKGHVPTAQHMNFDTLRGTEAGVPVQYLPEKMTKELLARAGVNKNKTHVLYAEGGTGDEILSATMVAYVLEKFGVKDIKILNGGLPDFKAKYALTQEYPTARKPDLPAAMSKGMAVDVKTLMKEKSSPQVVVVDARPTDEYLGKDDVWLRKGHIPGAVSLPWRNLVNDKNTHTFKSPKEVETLLKNAGITPDKDIIVYCGTSREGSLLRFYLKHLAGYPKVRLYEGSWKEYASLKDLPVETTPSRIQ